jgi:triacylglycerol esterase/lipase EstA (alpha/beta hydrolase family)
MTVHAKSSTPSKAVEVNTFPNITFIWLILPTVDYGAEHSQEHKHGQYGRKYSKGLYPEWSTEKPVHFVTHSLGGPTVTKLIALLRAKFFGDEYHPDMVRSVFAVAAPFKGTPTVYLLGASYTGSHVLRTFSVRTGLQNEREHERVTHKRPFAARQFPR